MSNNNKNAREELEKIYGKKCMLHEGLKIKGYSKNKINYKGKSIASQLTYHHIFPKHLRWKSNGRKWCCIMQSVS